MNYKPDLCIYHGNCADGFGAAWAIHDRWPDCEFHPGVYGEAPPDCTGKHVLLVDFSYKYDVLCEISFKASSTVVIDHHKTAQADLERLPPFTGGMDKLDFAFKLNWTQNTPEIAVWFDMEQSGAIMAWKFANDMNENPPRLLEYVQDRDLLRFDLDGSREVAAVVFSHPYDFDAWHDLIARAQADADLGEMIREGAAIERKHHKDVAELLKVTARPMTIGGVEVMCANMPYTMASDAAGKLAEGSPFGACYFDRADGARVFSLRSRGEGGVDVSEIAARYGGGGHRNVAGFQAPAGWLGE